MSVCLSVSPWKPKFQKLIYLGTRGFVFVSLLAYIDPAKCSFHRVAWNCTEPSRPSPLPTSVVLKHTPSRVEAEEMDNAQPSVLEGSLSASGWESFKKCSTCYAFTIIKIHPRFRKLRNLRTPPPLQKEYLSRSVPFS